MKIKHETFTREYCRDPHVEPLPRVGLVRVEDHVDAVVLHRPLLAPHQLWSNVDGKIRPGAEEGAAGEDQQAVAVSA